MNRGGRYRFFICLTLAALSAMFCSECPAKAAETPPCWVFCASADNDLYQVMTSAGGPYPRYGTAAEAIRHAPAGAGLLILADGYPQQTTRVDSPLFDEAARNRLRLYIEYPREVPGVKFEPPQTTRWERAVVASEAFGPPLARMRILAIHNCRYLPVAAEHPHLVLARVAGFDTAVFGLPQERWPILFEHPRGRVLVATTTLSQFRTARYSPTDAWGPVWQMILGWLQPGRTVPPLHWTPAVRPSFGPAEPLPAKAERQAVRRGAEWYLRSGLLVHPSWKDRWDDVGGVSPLAKENDQKRAARPGYDRPRGDGQLGILEGQISRILLDGTQPTRWLLRADCNAESAFALALGDRLAADPSERQVAKNLCDFVYFRSPLQQGPRADPQNTVYGLLAWWCDYQQGHGTYYSNDAAKALVATMGTAALLGSDHWDESMLRCILAHFRITSPEGFCCINSEAALAKHDWRYFSGRHYVYARPQHMAWIAACYLWLYDKTKFRPLLTRAERAIRLTMERYPRDWKLSNQQIQMERSRLLLALAWLLRVDDTPEHRAWLDRIAGDLLARQAACGAVQEEVAVPLKSNEEYGSREMALIQGNEDRVADLLYVLPNVLFGLHEAVGATGDQRLARANDHLAQFLMRAQVRSEAHPELDGAWFRGFDYGRWDYWAVNGDAGWGTWCTETGWMQSYILAGLALREMKTTVWELTATSRIARHFEKYRQQMQIDEAVAIAEKAWAQSH